MKRVLTKVLAGGVPQVGDGGGACKKESVKKSLHDKIKNMEGSLMPPKHKQTPEKKNVKAILIEQYDIQTTGDQQAALKDLMCGTIQKMLESELDEELGYAKHEQSEAPKSNYRNGHKPKTLKSTKGEIEITVP